MMTDFSKRAPEDSMELWEWQQDLDDSYDENSMSSI